MLPYAVPAHTICIDGLLNLLAIAHSAPLLDELLLGKVRRGDNAAIDNQWMAIDKIRIVADQEQRGLGLIFGGSQTAGKILKSPAAGNVIIIADRRT